MFLFMYQRFKNELKQEGDSDFDPFLKFHFPRSLWNRFAIFTPCKLFTLFFKFAEF